VVSSILRDMGLNTKGEDVSTTSDGNKASSQRDNDNNDETDSSATDFKEHIQQILKNR
jgi:hypothetical protein